MITVCLVMVTGTIYAEMFDIKIGDDIDRVQNALGEPDSYILLGDKALVSYGLSKIELVSNKVTKVNFVSAAKTKELRLKTKTDNKKRRAYLIREGNTVKQRKLENVEFLSSPLSEQIDFWHSFRRHYPMIDLSPVNLADLATKAAEDTQRKREEDEEYKANEEELLQAKWKLMEAEERAHQAELEANSRNTRYSRGYTSYLYPPQVIIPGRPCYPVRPTPYGCLKPVSPFRPGGGNRVGGSSHTTVSPHASRWPSHTPGVFPNTVK